jgi:hypothetical protein
LFAVGDAILSRDENDPIAPVDVQVVEEVFRRTAPIYHLTVNGKLIRTRGEHPFFEESRGWIAAAELLPGDRLASLDGHWLTVEELVDTNEYEVVYNLRVSEYHTYFVGSTEWGFSVWAHNAECVVEQVGDRWRVRLLGEGGDTYLRNTGGRNVYSSATRANAEAYAAGRGHTVLSDIVAQARVRSQELRAKYGHLSEEARQARIEELREANYGRRIRDLEATHGTPNVHSLEKHGAQTTSQAQLDRVSLPDYPNPTTGQPGNATKTASRFFTNRDHYMTLDLALRQQAQGFQPSVTIQFDRNIGENVRNMGSHSNRGPFVTTPTSRAEVRFDPTTQRFYTAFPIP